MKICKISIRICKLIKIPRNGLGVDQFVIHWVGIPSSNLYKILLGTQGQYLDVAELDQPAIIPRMSFGEERNRVRGSCLVKYPIQSYLDPLRVRVLCFRSEFILLPLSYSRLDELICLYLNF